MQLATRTVCPGTSLSLIHTRNNPDTKFFYWFILTERVLRARLDFGHYPTTVADEQAGNDQSVGAQKFLGRTAALQSAHRREQPLFVISAGIQCVKTRYFPFS